MRERRKKPSLTPRERQVLYLLCGGHSNKEIAVHLGLGVSTVNSYAARVRWKLAVASNEHLAEAARFYGLL